MKKAVLEVLLILGVIAIIVGLPQLNPVTALRNLFTESSQAEITKISAMESRNLLADESVFVLDVHTPEQSHLPGTDAVIPYDELRKRKSELPSSKDTPILVYCRSGGMSAEAASTLAKLGYNNIYDLEGGKNAYDHSFISSEQAEEQNSNTISVAPEVQDLGTVIYGDVATTEFILTNNTEKPLEITRVSTSCGCTKAEAEDTSLEPGSETVIAVSFDPAVHKDDSDVGDITRTIYIETDNDLQENIEAEITAVVIKEEN